MTNRREKWSRLPRAVFFDDHTSGFTLVCDKGQS